MAISDPNHWIEEGFFKGPKYDKIVEIIAALNKHLMIGSGNAEWIPVPINGLIETAGVHGVVVTDDIKCQSGDPSLSFLLVKEYVRGGLNLQLSGFRWYQLAADGSNYVDRTRVFGLQNDGTVDTLYDDTDNQTSTGLKETGSGTLGALSIDTTSYLSIVAYFNTVTATANLLRMTFPEFECYYA